MPTSVTMPALGESVTEGTVTRWLKQEGERVETDEPLLEVSTDKVDTEIPSPASGVLSSIKVGEDETVEVGVELAVIDESGAGGGEAQEQQAPAEQPEQAQPEAQQADAQQAPAQEPEAPQAEPEPQQAEPEPEPAQQPAAEEQQPQTQEIAAAWQEPAPQQAQQPAQQQAPAGPDAEVQQQPQAPTTSQVPQQQPANQQAPASQAQAPQQGGDEAGAYVTPLVRKLASEHDVDLSSLTGSGVGGRIRKQDVLDAANAAKASAPSEEPGAPAAAAQAEPSRLRGTTEKMSRPRKVIAQRMYESLQSTAQLTTVVEADVTSIARLRQRAKADFQRREGVKLSFLPFFALAAIEALKIHPKLNAFIDVEAGEITYHETENLGIAVDSERGLMVPVIHNAGDLNLGGLARKIADLAERTRANKLGPDEISGGTFTLTNTGSRGALFDTPILNAPQVGILGTGTVVKRPVVVDDPDLGEVISVRSMVFLALTYDHRLVDGADAARFLVTVKDRLEAGSFEAELGLN